MSGCSHNWDHIHEESIIGGCFPIGWKCRKCGAFVGGSEVTPEGLAGSVSGRRILVGPHGGLGKTSDGATYRRQILLPDGKLIIEQD